MTTTIEGASEFVTQAVKDFTENLGFIRIKREMTYRELADRSGMTERNAYMIVTGKQGANIKTIASLAQALQVPTSDLFMDADRFAKRYEKAKPLPPLSLTTAPPVKKRSPKSTPVTKDSPFCKPEPRTAFVPLSPEEAA